MLGKNELQILIMVANDFIKTLPDSAAFAVSEQVKIAVGNLEAFLKAYDEVKPPVEGEGSP